MNMVASKRYSARIGRMDGIATSLAPFVPSIGWMDVDATLGMRQLCLPSDLYLITAYCSDGLTCGGVGESCDLEVSVSMLHTRPTLLQTLGSGQLAFALLTPEGAFRVLGAPLKGMLDRRVALEHFCGRAEQRNLRDSLLRAASASDRMQGLGRWIEARSQKRASLSVGELRVSQATRAMLNGGWRTGMIEMAASLSVTRRQLEREFEKWLDLSPAGYARLVRFQRAVSAIACGASTIDVATEAGFADQSHLTRVVREFTSMTPRQLRVDGSRPGRAQSRAAVAGRVLTVDVIGPSGVDLKESAAAIRTYESKTPPHGVKAFQLCESMRTIL